MNLPKLTAFIALTLPTLAACDNARMPYCEDTVTVLESLDTPTPAGMTAGELLEIVGGERLAQLDYTDGSDNAVQVDIGDYAEGTPLYLELMQRAGGELRWIESVEKTPPGNGPTPAIAIECPNRLEIDAELSFETEDGAFAELFDVVIRASVDDWGLDGDAGQINLARVVQAFDPSELLGDLEILSVEPEDPTSINYNISLDYPLNESAAEVYDGFPGLPSGDVSGAAQYEEEQGKGQDTAVSGFFQLASFVALDEPADD